ncbi:MAG: NmrA family NAD(P)-binding protein [Myxococcales bacterium]|nr:NmrA family NAD(P)-binding protein [Myxococcales bacterium]
MFAIAGVTGNTGAVVADTLLAAGAPVRVIVRDAAKAAPWRARGAEIAVADLADPAALTAALRGAAGAYLLIPPRPTSAEPLAENRAVAAAQAAAVAAARVPHVVLLSSVGAQHADGTGPIVSAQVAERVLAPLTQLTAIRAAFFMENWAAALGMLDQGVVPTFVPRGLTMPMVATRDIGKAAAAALLEGPRGDVRVELAGPRDYNADDVAAVLSTLTGRTITATDVPLDAVVPTYTSFGLSPAFAGLFRELYAGAASGRVAWEGGHRALRGQTDLATVLAPLLARA